MIATLKAPSFAQEPQLEPLTRVMPAGATLMKASLMIWIYSAGGLTPMAVRVVRAS